MKVLIVAGNVVAVFAIIAIVLLYNLNTQSVTIDENESREEDPEETDSKSEPSIEFRKINHSETVVQENNEDENNEEQAEADEATDEESTESTEEEIDETITDTNTAQSSETEWTSVSDNGNNSESQSSYSSNKSSNSTSNNSTASSEKSTSSNTNTSSKKEEETSGASEDEPEKEKEPVKEEVTCSNGETKQNGKCVGNAQIYYSKVQSSLPSGFSAGLNGNSVTISNSDGTVATISVSSVSQNKIQFIGATEDQIGKVDGALGGLIY